MEISVIVPTYQGKHKLPRILGALDRQSEKDFEVIVVVDGSTDGTVEWLGQQKVTFRNFQILSQENGGRAEARNAGARIAKGKLLIFYDDDMDPGENSVARHVEVHARFRRAVVGGNPLENISADKTDIQNYKAWLCTKWLKPFSEDLNAMNTTNLFFTAANCSIPKDLFDEIGGFDARLSDAEDYELARRAITRGVSVYFDAMNKAIHHDPVTCLGYIRRLRQYTEAHRQLRDLYPEIFSPRKTDFRFWKSLVYKIFSFRFWPRLVDRNDVLRLLPVRIRYKLYDLIIHSLAFENRHVSL